MKNALLVLAVTVVGSSALANTFLYKCTSYFWNNDPQGKGTMTLDMQDDYAFADIDNETWDNNNIGGEFNPNYKPKSQIPFIKYGNNLIVEEVLRTGGKILKDGSKGGFVRVEGQAEGGFYQYKFVCRR